MSDASTLERRPEFDIAEWFKSASVELEARGYADSAGRLIDLKDNESLSWLCFDNEARPCPVQAAKLVRDEDANGLSIQLRVRGHNKDGNRASTRIQFSYNEQGAFQPEGSFIKDTFINPQAVGERVTAIVTEARTEPGCEGMAGVVVSLFDEHNDKFVYELISGLAT